MNEVGLVFVDVGGKGCAGGDTRECDKGSDLPKVFVVLCDVGEAGCGFGCIYVALSVWM
jgi:hypothetical protein